MMHSLPMNRLAWVAGIAIAFLAVFGARSLDAPQASAQTSTPTPALTWTFNVNPASPVVGDDIKLTAYASGSGGLPQYTLILEDSPAIVALESPGSVSTNMLGTPKSWDLGTLLEGQAHFHININYEREICNPSCFFEFTFDESPPMTFDVGEGVAVGGIASLPKLEADSPAGRNYMALQIALITAGSLLAIGAVVWFARRRALR